jgi:hypothetical protein
MVSYTGRFPTKQFMFGKPIKWGYKIFILADSLGFPYHILPYQGKCAAFQRNDSLGDFIVKKMVNVVKQV